MDIWKIGVLVLQHFTLKKSLVEELSSVTNFDQLHLTLFNQDLLTFELYLAEVLLVGIPELLQFDHVKEIHVFFRVYHRDIAEVSLGSSLSVILVPS